GAPDDAPPPHGVVARALATSPLETTLGIPSFHRLFSPPGGVDVAAPPWRSSARRGSTLRWPRPTETSGRRQSAGHGSDRTRPHRNKPRNTARAARLDRDAGRLRSWPAA